MASALYPKFKQLLADPTTLGTTSGTAVDLAGDNIKISLIRTSAYTYSAAHDFVDDAPTRVMDSGNLGSKTVTNGVFDAADVVFTAVPAGAAIDALLVWKDTGTPSTSPLIAYIDGISVVPNGGDVTVVFNASGIFAL